MSNFKKFFSLLLVVVMVLSMFAGCNDSGSQGGTEPSENTSGETGTYSVTVKSAGGMKMEGVTVYIFRDEAKTDMVDYGETDKNGKASFDLAKGGTYYIGLDGLPKGYEVKDTYGFTSNSAQITVKSSVITDETLSSVSSLKLGDVMYDFEVTTPAGEKFKLSEELKQKDMVLINFWYTTCTWCIKEFPYMEEAYQMYKDDVGIIAVDYLDDSNDAVAAFQSTYGLTFPMATCPSNWFSIFGTQGAPTSIIVDRYGVICHIEEGALTSLRPFTSIFEHFTGDDYEQKVLTSLDDIVTNVKPTYDMPSSDEIGAVINNGDVQVSYRGEEKDEYAWPFIITEKNGVSCIKSSNSLIEASYSILYADVTLKAGEAIGFDYLISSERGADVLHVIVDDEPIYTISGVSDVEEWKSAYPWVADKDGTYEVALCYIKDDSTDEGEDAAYIKNMRVCSASEIDVDTYLPRQAATSEDGFEYQYVDVFYNSKDGYYHVGSVNGPLLLANMNAGYTEFNDNKTLWNIVYDDALMLDGELLYDKMVSYFSYASNSSLIGYCTVNKELAVYLKAIADLAGFSDDENEWLKMCKYYEAYGKNVKQLQDPIKGLAPFSAYEAKLGKNISSNSFYYDTAIIPRGKLAKFVPTKSGVYRITSRSESDHGVDGWIFDGNRNELLVYEMDERLYNDSNNVSMVFYMKAGEAYYIDIAFWDVYEVGYIYYDIEYVAPTLQHFRLASPGYFTYDSNATGDAMYHLIAGGIDVVLGSDGYYYEDLGNGKRGSKLYADFTGVTSLFSNPISTVNSYDENGNLIRDDQGNIVKIKGMIDMGGFDFSKTEEDLYILGVMAKHNNDIEATKEYLKNTWGEEYDANAKQYQIEDVFEGKYHGGGEDLTAEISKYLSKMYSGSAKERVGCVEVDVKLAEILQKLMDKYTFSGVDHSWVKLCYYYDYLGPEA
ncbi:MAG: redoxin domain-containing protein [Oscillospiraceae bacterium]|nr:redoxin domain-containing protein [Oscillospiraceae bacterium]